jgi:hypothetical protein
LLLSLINTHINITSQKFSSTPFHLLFIILYSSPPCGSTPVLPGYLLLRHSCTWDKTSIFWLCQLSKHQMLFFALNICFKRWVVTNQKSSNYLTFNCNPYEPLVRNLLNHFRRERLIYFRVLPLFFCVLGISVLYSTHFFHHAYEIRGMTFYL